MTNAHDTSDRLHRLVSNKSDTAYRRIREAIITLELEPGAFIDKAEISNSLGVSRQPVTTALSRLAHEGLVDVFPQHGSYVSMFNLGTMLEAQFVRTALESLTLARLAAAPSEHVINELQLNLDSQRTAIEDNDRAQLRKLDWDFHDIIGTASGYQAVSKQISDALAFMRRTSHIDDYDHMMAAPEMVSEHETIVAMIIAKDSSGIGVFLERHVAHSTAALTALSRIRRDLFR